MARNTPSSRKPNVTSAASKIGLRILRFNDRQVLLETDSVAEEIFRAVEENPP